MREMETEGEPAHHARRPMNAFLIFCKRHRSVVRDKYPNLENRSITKILGEWWANLDKDDKACYTGLAKQYKDAFFNANPDFKWYKLPAPPLRTLSSRPREPNDRSVGTPSSDYPDEELEKTTNNNSTQVDFNKPDDAYEERPISMFTPGKLADEAHMGGLSSLLATKTETQTINPYYMPQTYKVIPKSEDCTPKSLSKEDSIRELQNALSETTRMFEDLDETGKAYPKQEPLTNQDVIDEIVDKGFTREEEYQRQWSDDDKNSKSGRSCKGKRYQEFMAVGGLLVNKRQKRDHDYSPEDSYNWDPNSSRSEDSPVNDDSKTLFSNETFAETDSVVEAHEPDNAKPFKPADFDLDAKIRALPSLSLEKFQQRKRENKRKKRTFNPKPKAPEQHPSDARREMAEVWRENVIGSQKRKPRKISINRLEINSLVSSVDLSRSHKTSPEIKLATEAPCTMVQDLDRQALSADMFALATLAEVASHTSKINETDFATNMATITSDHNASKV